MKALLEQCMPRRCEYRMRGVLARYGERGTEQQRRQVRSSKAGGYCG